VRERERDREREREIERERERHVIGGGDPSHTQKNAYECEHPTFAAL